MIETEIKGCKIAFGQFPVDLKRFLTGGKQIFIVDEAVWDKFGRYTTLSSVIKVKGREEFKTLETVKKIYEILLDQEADKYTWLIGLGGGVVLDITGFVASTYLRGVQYGFVPTTLLAQVDASIGGKNGVNFKGIKNVIGVINQPSFVLIDTNFLNTLPRKEFENGYSEIIKHAVIGGKELFETLELMPLEEFQNKKFIERLIWESILVKAEIVKRDEFDFGERRKLNFGHTFGHAIETTYRLSHGYAVALGMILEARYSMEKGFLSRGDFIRIESLLRKFGLPTSPPKISERVSNRIRGDKKREDKFIHFVIIDGIGSSRIEKVRIEEVMEVLHGVCEHR
jgi:3-dehydroquinate synthase